jgi:succinate dehydrogenase flavin-adding protein (antitoxin of CptAB toxin-antitoxin module)
VDTCLREYVDRMLDRCPDRDTGTIVNILEKFDMDWVYLELKSRMKGQITLCYWGSTPDAV